MKPSNIKKERPITRVNIQKTVGKNYAGFWNSKKRYLVCKGSRASKKSTTASLKLAFNIPFYFHKYGEKPSAVVLRRFYNSHRDSTFPQLQWAINQLGMTHLWKFTMNPMEMVYKPSGQKILFKGFDNADSLTSLAVEEGYVCWSWIEEAYQIENKEAFDKFDGSIRGLPDDSPLFYQHMFTFNPWSDKTWLKKEFFDKAGDIAPSEIDTFTRNYNHNEFIDEGFINLMEGMMVRNPRRYRIEGLGDWGISQGLIYTNWKVDKFDEYELKRKMFLSNDARYIEVFGMDFGFTADPTTFIRSIVDTEKKIVYVCEEWVGFGATNSKIVEVIEKMGHRNKLIYCDSAEPRTISELQNLGLNGLMGIKKGGDRKEAGIRKLQDYKIIVHPDCNIHPKRKGSPEIEKELSNYTWDIDKQTGQQIDKPISEFDHCLDALRYSIQNVNNETFIW